MSKIKVLVIAAIALAAFAAFPDVGHEEVKYSYIRPNNRVNQSDPPCIQMYHYIEQYADSFDIPKRYAYGIAHVETSYNGPFHWRYNPSRISNAGALGPMQVMLATARGLNKDGVSREKLLKNIEYNVYTSMKLLRRLYNLRHNWKVVFGEYNTGRPCINGYAERVYNHKLSW